MSVETFIHPPSFCDPWKFLLPTTVEPTGMLNRLLYGLRITVKVSELTLALIAVSNRDDS